MAAPGNSPGPRRGRRLSEVALGRRSLSWLRRLKCRPMTKETALLVTRCLGGTKHVSTSTLFAKLLSRTAARSDGEGGRGVRGRRKRRQRGLATYAKLRL
uniref:Uncharacterized protein n=1 Tax=Magallana gigas TaxID=29159 RepID=K1QZT5_MAGGI